MIPDAYELILKELAVQTQKMNALNAAMEVTDDKVWRDKMFEEFGAASFLVAALHSAKQRMEEKK